MATLAGALTIAGTQRMPRRSRARSSERAIRQVCREVPFARLAPGQPKSGSLVVLEGDEKETKEQLNGKVVEKLKRITWVGVGIRTNGSQSQSVDEGSWKALSQQELEVFHGSAFVSQAGAHRRKNGVLSRAFLMETWALGMVLFRISASHVEELGVGQN